MSFGTYQRLNVHVMASNRTVIRAARKKIDKKFRRDPDSKVRAARKSFYLSMLEYHARERGLFLAVIRGAL